MTLLLVDDEKLTRQGIMASLDWKALQIHQVLEAADGAEALALAKEALPEIVLTDIRMPHMDGVTFAKELHEALPDTHIIFMSGFSDKEYLHAAIRLKVVSYVEKPINNDELAAAIAEAVQLHEVAEHHKHTQQLQHQELASELVLTLTKPLLGEAPEALGMVSRLGLPLDEDTSFCFLIAQTTPPILSNQDLTFRQIMAATQAACANTGLGYLQALRRDSTLLLLLHSQAGISPSALEALTQELTGQLSAELNWFLAVGPVVTGLSSCHESYSHAAILMQRSFFADANSILSDRRQGNTDSHSIEATQTAFTSQVMGRDLASATATADKLLAQLKDQTFLLPSNVKDLYFKLFISLEQAYHVELIASQEGDASIWDRILACDTLASLHSLLTSELWHLKGLSQAAPAESSAVSYMKDYVHTNFANASLSVKDISDHAKLSVTYACTVFKTETGKTMNQYLTEYRLERAKELLLDPRVKITDISARVGYTDSGYFGKAFKKATGLTPSEYREKLLT